MTTTDILNRDAVSAPLRSRVIDLRRRFSIEVKADPVRGEFFTAIDHETFDDDPEGRMHIVGFGRSSSEAITSLLEQLAAGVVS